MTHLHTPFHIFLGSYLSALRTIARDERAQKEGSDCVVNCSLRGKYDSMVPAAKASLNSCLPFVEEKGIRVDGSDRP